MSARMAIRRLYTLTLRNTNTQWLATRSRALLEKLIDAQLPQFYGPWSSLSCSQQPATGLYTEQFETIHTLMHSPLWSVLILSSHLCLSLPNGLFSLPKTVQVRRPLWYFITLHSLTMSCYPTDQTQSWKIKFFGCPWPLMQWKSWVRLKEQI
jgi:hypothetical protein